MYRQTVIPQQADFIIHFPDEFVGKEVEIVFNLKENPIALENEKELRRQKALERLKNSRRMDLSDFKFDREEANER